jgi:hypothetical protein
MDAIGITTLLTSEADPHDPAFYLEMTATDDIL